MQEKVSTAVSLCELHTEASEKVVPGGKSEDEVPCLSTFQLHLVPFNKTNASVSRYHGTLNIKQSLTPLEDCISNPDGHYNVKLYQIIKVKLVNICKGINEVEDKVWVGCAQHHHSSHLKIDNGCPLYRLQKTGTADNG